MALDGDITVTLSLTPTQKEVCVCTVYSFKSVFFFLFLSLTDVQNLTLILTGGAQNLELILTHGKQKPGLDLTSERGEKPQSLVAKRQKGSLPWLQWLLRYLWPKAEAETAVRLVTPDLWLYLTDAHFCTRSVLAHTHWALNQKNKFINKNDKLLTLPIFQTHIYITYLRDFKTNQKNPKN